MNEKISFYVPSLSEQLRLQEEGITLEQLLQYDQPSHEELENMKEYNIGLVDAIFLTDLRLNTIDTISQIAPLTFSKYPRKDDFPEVVKQNQTHFIELCELRLSQNGYPGKNFSKEKLQFIVDMVKKQEWTPDTIKGYLDEINSLLLIISED